jgi:hypothetical protein
MAGAVRGQDGDEPRHVDLALVHVPALLAPRGGLVERVEERALSTHPAGHVLHPGAVRELDPADLGKGGVESELGGAEQAELTGTHVGSVAPVRDLALSS